MKTKLLLLAMAIYVGVANAQITMESQYNGRLHLTHIASDFKYYTCDYNVPLQINIYSSNHSLYKTINVPSTFLGTGGYGIFYVSDSLFSVDTTIEFIVVNYNTDPKIYILDENLTVLFSKDSAYNRNPSSIDGQYTNFIFDTPSGTKMNLCNANNNSWDTNYVYSLPGTLPPQCLTTNGNIISANNSAQLSHPFPNPSQNSTQVNYKLPNGEKSGEIIFYNLSGTEVKRFKVDNTFNNLVLNNSDLPSGTYLYHLVTSTQATNAKKMVVIK